MRFFQRAFFIVLVLFGMFSYAQEQKKSVDINLINGDFYDLVNKIEEQTNYHFYFSDLTIKNLDINIEAKSLAVDKVLNQVFKNTQIQYSFVENNIFITDSIALQTSLPLAFLKTPIVIDQSVVVKKPEIEAVIINSNLDNKLYVIGNKKAGESNTATVFGYLKDDVSGKSVAGARVFTKDVRREVITDQKGYYRLNLPTGYHTLYVEALGLENTSRKLLVNSDAQLNISLNNRILALDEVVVGAKRAVNITSARMGVEKIEVKSIKKIPALFGEVDVLRAVLTLPGVKSVGEASTGFNIRGGSTDQNLILFNDYTIYNPSHFFGFFSAINSDLIKDLELYKSSIPAKYGGRLSAVLDISAKDGNNNKLKGAGGIGLLTSRISLEGPIGNGKTTIIAGGRSTYSNWLMDMLPKKEYDKSSASFYDLNFDIKHQFNANNSLKLATYYSDDRFKLRGDTLYNYNNKSITLKWFHGFSNKLQANFSGSYSDYKYNVKDEVPSTSDYKLNFNISQADFKTEFNYILNSNHTLQFGVNSKYYKINPGSLKPNSSTSLLESDIVESEQALESALYLEDTYNIGQKFTLNYGLRYSLFNYLGPKSVNEYVEGLPKSEATLLNVIPAGDASILKTYHGPEFRLSARYSFTENMSIKAGYNTLRQYIHMLSNSTSISPTDIWKLSDPNIKPQTGDQISLGLYRNFKANTIETSVEVYYKNINDYLDYKSGAVLVLNHAIETDVLKTIGKAYGLEVSIKKLSGKLNGWLSYTYSRTFLKTGTDFATETINRGDFYPANYDKPHDVTLAGNYRLSHRFSISLNTIYSTGRPITLPIAKFDMNGGKKLLYSDRNEYRIPDYFRTDLSFNIEGNHKIKKLAHSSWSLGVYNLTGRKNAFSTYFVAENNRINGYKLSIFGQPIPFLTYNFRF